MPSDRWAEVERLYHDALQHAADERAAFLAEACGGDDAVRREVQSLLDHEEAAAAFLERPALEEEAKGLRHEPSPLGERDIDGYRILSLLGAGGMGEVYRARDLTLGREVAIKVLRRSAAGGPGDLRRFEEEARLASVLNHPNIVTIYGVGEKGDIAYIAMELVRGRTLRDVLADGPLPVETALGVAVQLADALSAAHAEGIVHRDLKPENLMVTPEGFLKVLDFGIAKLQGSGDAAGAEGRGPGQGVQTQAGTILGTVGYMSPEQAAGHPAEPASDQFSFGAILYEMLSGRRAFRRDTPRATLDAILREEPEPIQGLDAAVSPALREALSRCLAKTPSGRYPQTRDLAAQLRRIKDERDRRKTASAATRRRALWLSGAAAVALAAGLAAWTLHARDTGIRSLAVLPFTNASGDASADYLSDGLTNGVIREISRLPSLHVKPRGAVLHFKGNGVDPRAAGRLLAADAVVTGTVTQKAGRLQVAAALIDVRSGKRLWSRTFDGAAADTLSIQDEVASAIVDDGIRLQLSGDDRRQLARRPTDDPAAYDLYLRAIQLCERGAEGDYLEARDLLGKALARDPNFALAYVALATTYSEMAVDGYERPADALPHISHNVRRALDCDQDLPDAHSEAAVVLFYFQWDWAGSEREWSRAIQSRGGGFVPDALAACALQKWALGKPDEALALIRKARALDPLSPGLMIQEADLLLHARSLDAAADLYERVIGAARGSAAADSGPTLSNAWLGLAEVRKEQERFDDAIQARRRADEASGDDTLGGLASTARGAEGYREIERRTARAQLEDLQRRAADGGYASPLDFARVYAQLGDRQRALDLLDAALQDRSPGLVFLRVDRAWDGVRNDPRFLEAVRTIGLPASS
jgi:serine/threonine protein kinase/tetratricopeptide (TPR) repeat protein